MRIHNIQATGSSGLSGNQSITGSLTVTGDIIAQQYVVSSSVSYLTESFASGSHKFGDSSDDTHQFTGSVLITGSLNVNKGVVTLPDSIHTSAQINFKNVGTESELMRFPASNQTMTFYGATDKIYWKTDKSISNQNILSLVSDGNVGIGSLTPDFGSSGDKVLTIQGTDVRASVQLQNSSTGTSGVAGSIKAFNSTTFLTSIDMFADGATNTGGFILYTNNAGTTGERLRVKGAGNVYINTSSNPLLDNATPQLAVLGGSTTDAVSIKHLADGNNTFNIWQTGTTAHNAIVFYKGDTQAGRGNINVTTSGVTYNSTSDYRLKENIVPIQNGIDRLMQLKPSKFNWIETGHESEGFIAHELQEIFPDAVTGEKDAVYASTGNIKAQSVDYGRITPLLVKAIQEQQSLIESLQNRLAALENA